MPSVKIKDDLYKSLSNYCKLNDIVIVDYVNRIIGEKLNEDLYGEIPFGEIVKTSKVSTQERSIKENVVETPKQDSVEDKIEEIESNIKVTNNKRRLK